MLPSTCTNKCKPVLSFTKAVHPSSQSKSPIWRTLCHHVTPMESCLHRMGHQSLELLPPMVSEATLLEASKPCSNTQPHSKTVTTLAWLRVSELKSRRQEITKSARMSSNRWHSIDATQIFCLKAGPVDKSAAPTDPKSTPAWTLMPSSSSNNKQALIRTRVELQTYLEAWILPKTVIFLAQLPEWVYHLKQMGFKARKHPR
jgi:hypothetical protein